MRKILFAAFLAVITITAGAQVDTTVAIPRRPASNLPRSNDHLLVQIGYLFWQNKPDTINTGGIPRTLNVYFMFDFPFRTNPHWSVGIGAGVASDNMFFTRMEVGIADPTPTLEFRNLSDTVHFKKYKLSTAYLEAPIELRFSSRPHDNSRSFKFALGAKVGTMLQAKTKGKNLQSSQGQTINSFTQKEISKRFFNSTRLSVMGRVGYGNFSLFTSYQLTNLFTEGVAAPINPMTVGLTLSGL